MLFVCTHNSARSQMAEAMLNAWGEGKFEAFSAGTEATGIKPETIQVMDEIGISLDGHRSKTIDEFRGQAFEWFITVCDEAQKNCPVLPGVGDVAHWSIEDPSLAEGTTEERLEVFRQVRDLTSQPAAAVHPRRRPIGHPDARENSPQLKYAWSGRP